MISKFNKKLPKTACAIIAVLCAAVTVYELVMMYQAWEERSIGILVRLGLSTAGWCILFLTYLHLFNQKRKEK